MHVNNETGAIQPLNEIAAALRNHPAYFHADAAQGFGKDLASLQSTRIDLLSVRGHKIFGPKGIGALIARRRGFDRIPLSPLMYGGGQERGLRPGTLAVPLIVGIGKAAELALKHHSVRRRRCREFREVVLKELRPLEPRVNVDESAALPHVLSLSFSGLDSEAVMVAVKDLLAVSNGSACTSASYKPSHVLKAMDLSEEEIRGTLRFSWCHSTGHPDWAAVRTRIAALKR